MIDSYRNHCIHKEMKPDGININLRAIKTFFNWCYKRELIEKQRQETYQRKLQFIVMNAKKEEAKSTIVFIAEKLKMKQTPSLDLIPGLDAKVTSHPFILFFPPGFIYMILTDKATIGRPGPNL